MTASAPGPAEASLDLYARLVQRALGVPLTLVSLVQSDRQVFCGAHGLPPDLEESRQTPLSHSFCQYVVHDREPLVISDARLDARLHTNLAIDDLGVVAYAGWPISDHTGSVIGSLCAIDHAPRVWSTEDLDILRDLAEACSSELSQRGLRAEALAREQAARETSQRSRVLLTLSQSLAHARSARGVARALDAIAGDYMGCLHTGVWLASEERSGQPLRVPGHAAASDREFLTLVHEDAAGEQQDSAVAAALDPRLPTRDHGGLQVSFVPLLAGGRDHGVLALAWPEGRVLTEDDHATITALASYTAQALQRVLLFEDRMEALVTLQTALMPRIPEPEHLDLAARYRPASEHDQVGGDWYDAVVMPSGAISVMIGDVVGHDLGAAATMVQLRHMLRTLAWAIDQPPSTNVSWLEAAMGDLDLDALASLVYARIEPMGDGRHVLHWTNAGHPPPLLVLPDGGFSWLGEESDEGKHDLMLGVVPDAERRDHTVVIPAGAIVLLYTDGLVERRGADLESGLARLAEAGVRHRHARAHDFVDLVLDDLLGRVLADDVAALAIRFDRP